MHTLIWCEPGWQRQTRFFATKTDVSSGTLQQCNGIYTNWAPIETSVSQHFTNFSFSSVYTKSILHPIYTITRLVNDLLTGWNVRACIYMKLWLSQYIRLQAFLHAQPQVICHLTVYVHNWSHVRVRCHRIITHHRWTANDPNRCVKLCDRTKQTYICLRHFCEVNTEISTLSPRGVVKRWKNKKAGGVPLFKSPLTSGRSVFSRYWRQQSGSSIYSLNKRFGQWPGSFNRRTRNTWVYRYGIPLIDRELPELSTKRNQRLTVR